MTFDDLPAGSSVFLDANTFVYPFAPEPDLGPPCADLMRRIEKEEVVAFKATLGRVFNLLGEPIDNRGLVHSDEAIALRDRRAQQLRAQLRVVRRAAI